MVNRETFRIDIQGKSVWYADRRWSRSIRLIPRDKEFLKKIMFSRGKIPSIVKELFELTNSEQEEFDNAKDARELADICKRDCKKHGARLLNEDSEMVEIKEDG